MISHRINGFKTVRLHRTNKIRMRGFFGIAHGENSNYAKRCSGRYTKSTPSQSHTWNVFQRIFLFNDVPTTISTTIVTQLAESWGMDGRLGQHNPQ